MKKETKVVFVAEDGEIFNSESDCLKHEKILEDEKNRYSYWIISHGPDRTEGRGNYRKTYVRAATERHGTHYMAKGLVEDWCYRNIGRKVAFVQGVAPTNNWSVHESDLNGYSNPSKPKVGDYSHDYSMIDLVMGEKEAGLIEVTE